MLVAGEQPPSQLCPDMETPGLSCSFNLVKAKTPPYPYFMETASSTRGTLEVLLNSQGFRARRRRGGKKTNNACD